MNALQQSSDSFVRHEPCPRCGSRDNLARYSSGSAFCFGCGYYVSGSRHHLGSQVSGFRGNNGSVQLGEASNQVRPEVRPPPDDIGTYYGGRALEWLRKYDIGVADLIKHNVKWSPSREQLIYQFFGADKDLVLWQARNFREGTAHKDRFYTGGKPEDVVAAYYPDESIREAAIVEDCVSGIKCARAGVAGIPCFGSTMSKTKLARIARLYGSVTVWLDEDKYNEGKKLATQLALLGCKTKVLQTSKDPKEYDDNVIRNFANII